MSGKKCKIELSRIKIGDLARGIRSDLHRTESEKNRPHWIGLIANRFYWQFLLILKTIFGTFIITPFLNHTTIEISIALKVKLLKSLNVLKSQPLCKGVKRDAFHSLSPYMERGSSQILNFYLAHISKKIKFWDYFLLKSWTLVGGQIWQKSKFL